MNSDKEPIEVTHILPGGRTKTVRKWNHPKTSAEEKDNAEFERQRKAHERNTGKESVDGSVRIVRSHIYRPRRLPFWKTLS